MNLEKSSHSGVNIVRLTFCCMEYVNKMLAAFHVDYFCTSPKFETNQNNDPKTD
jgi:hypothetical protein